jgi:large subunit ribosomal protein L24
MERTYSSKWRSSAKPRKQRKARAKAPLHIAGHMMHSPLSKDLRKKHGHRSVRIRTGDTVKVMRGQFSGKEGKVEKVDMKHRRLIVDKLEISKKDGSKTRYPIDPSKVMILELNTDDKKRFKRKEGEKA